MTALDTHVLTAALYRQVYVDIKLRPTVAHGAQQLLAEIKRLDEVRLTRKERQVIQEHIEINGNFAHPEKFLLSMLGTVQQPHTVIHGIPCKERQLASCDFVPAVKKTLAHRRAEIRKQAICS